MKMWGAIKDEVWGEQEQVSGGDRESDSPPWSRWVRVGSGRRRGRSLECEVFWKEVPVHLDPGSNRLDRRKLKATAWQVLGESTWASVHVCTFTWNCGWTQREPTRWVGPRAPAGLVSRGKTTPTSSITELDANPRFRRQHLFPVALFQNHRTHKRNKLFCEAIYSAKSFEGWNVTLLCLTAVSAKAFVPFSDPHNHSRASRK